MKNGENPFTIYDNCCNIESVSKTISCLCLIELSFHLHLRFDSFPCFIIIVRKNTVRILNISFVQFCPVPVVKSSKEVLLADVLTNMGLHFGFKD